MPHPSPTLSDLQKAKEEEKRTERQKREQNTAYVTISVVSITGIGFKSCERWLKRSMNTSNKGDSTHYLIPPCVFALCAVNCKAAALTGEVQDLRPLFANVDSDIGSSDSQVRSTLIEHQRLHLETGEQEGKGEGEKADTGSPHSLVYLAHF